MLTFATSLALVAMGFGLKAVVDAVLEWRSMRPRRATTAASYFSPCTNCTITKTSEIGLRINRLALRAVERVRGRRRGQVEWRPQ
jgi:hypothetical protein